MRFEYIEPASLEEAIDILAQYDGKAKIIAGGTDLVGQMRLKKIEPEYVVDIAGIPGLDYIRYDEKQGLRIGALATMRALETSAELRRKYPVVSQAASQLGSLAIRMVATVGGNLCNAAPSAETAPALIGVSAKARIVGPSGERVVPLEEFFTGPGATVLKKGELLVELQAPVPPANIRGVYLKHSFRGTIDLAIVGVAAVGIVSEGEVCKDIKIVLGAVAPVPMRALDAEKLLRGKKIDDGMINRSARAASGEARPISDVRASAEYRRKMVEVFTRRALRQVMGIAA